MLRRYGWPLLLSLGLLTSCSKEATQIIVAVDSDMRVPLELAAVRAVVRWEGDDAVADRRFELGGGRLEGDRITLPFSFGVGPAGDLGAKVTIELHALGPAGGVHFIRRAVTGFREGQSLFLPMYLASSCAVMSCGAADTCTEEGCKPADIDPGTLLVVPPGTELEIPFGRDGGLPPLDAGPRDASPDAMPSEDAEAGVDARADAGPDMDAAEPEDSGDAGVPPSCGMGLVDGDPCGPGGFRCCAGACVDTDSTASACGGNCIDCGANSRCNSGTCVCVSPFENCDQEPGCEADLTSDSSNCGTCFEPCQDGTSCIGGDCRTCAGDGDCVEDTLECTGTPNCSGGECEQPLLNGWCLIGGGCFLDGQTRPSNPCEVCRINDPFQWSPNPGTICNDGLFCTAVDRCDTTGQCAGSGSPCPQNPPSCVSFSCSETGGCAPIVQMGFCAIGNTCVTAGTVNPSNPCQRCAPAANPLGWSPNQGAVCNDGRNCTLTDRCDAAGACVGTDSPCTMRPCGNEICMEGNPPICQVMPFPDWCVINSACVMMGETDPNNNCFGCQPMFSQFMYTPLPDGTSCGIANTCCAGQCVLDVGGTECVGLPCGGICPVGQTCQCDPTSGNCVCCDNTGGPCI